MRARDLIGAIALALTGGSVHAQTVETAPAPDASAPPAPIEDPAAPPPVAADGAFTEQAASAAPVFPAPAATFATVQDDASLQVSDPWEGVNRRLYAVHNVLDGIILEPIALGYRAIMPRPARSGVRNVLNNLNSPVVLANDVLQGSPKKAGVTIARFGINTTLGVAGIFDVADRMGLKRRSEDFGQTLGVWGAGEGPFLFIPLLGPTNVRDGVGRIVDFAFDPLNYATYDHDDTVNLTRAGLTAVDAREQLIEAVRDIEATSSDPYAATKRFYTKSRRAEIKDGAVDVESLPDFDFGAGPS
jgi:phospholipid-binding lipoprotein MlaA